MASPSSSTKPTPSATQEDAIAGQRIGPYMLLRRLGQGGMAEVFVARLEREGAFRKLVAIKRMLSDASGEMAFAQRFLDETRTVACLSHPNLVQVFDAGTQDGCPYLVMEYVDGVDLWRVLHVTALEGKPMDVAAAVYIAAEAARGLGYVHAASLDGRPLNIVHRDISPQNLMLGRNGEVKILDFGIAKAHSESLVRSAKTQHNAIMGKMRYMAPEQLDGRELDGRTDLFALGVVLYELLTAKRLMNGKSAVDIVRQVRDASFDPPSKANPLVRPELDAIVMKMLAREPEHRYPDGNVVAKVLQTYLSIVAPGYGHGDLVEVLERSVLSPVPSAPPAPPKSVPEVSVGSILESELLSDPSPASAGASPIAGPAAAPEAREFASELASRLEPLPARGREPSPERLIPVHTPVCVPASSRPAASTETAVKAPPFMHQSYPAIDVEHATPLAVVVRVVGPAPATRSSWHRRAGRAFLYSAAIAAALVVGRAPTQPTALAVEREHGGEASTAREASAVHAAATRSTVVIRRAASVPGGRSLR